MKREPPVQVSKQSEDGGTQLRFTRPQSVYS